MWTLWWSCWAVAAPVALPEGEAPADWDEVLTLVGMELAEGTLVDGVQLRDDGARWTVVVLGTERSAEVAVPQSRSDREDIAQLAASLWASSARAGPLPELPGLPELPASPQPASTPPPAVAPAAPVPEPAPAAAPPTPAPAPAADPPPEPVPVTTEPAHAEPAPVVPTSAPAPLRVPVRPDPLAAVQVPQSVTTTAPVRPRAPEPSPWRAWGSLGLALRSTVRPSARGELWAARAIGPLLAGAGVVVRSPSLLTGLSVERQASGAGLDAGVWWAGRALGVGGVVGAMARSFYERGLQSTVGVPHVGACAWTAPFRVPLRLEARVHRDLRPVELYVDDVREQVYEPWGVSLAVGVIARPPASTRANQAPGR